MSDGSANSVNALINIAPNTAGTTAVYTNAQNMIFVQCSFGDSYGTNHVTQVTMQRYSGDFYWIGTVISSFNQ